MTVLRPKRLLQPAELRPLARAEETERFLPLPQRVNRAIDRGVAYLLAHHKKNNQYRKYLGLLGLTLLECGMPAGDPSVQRIAALIRAQQRNLTQTYELTLAILFLDRLGKPGDGVVIRRFGQRLLEGQFNCGAWTYSCLAAKHLRARINIRPRDHSFSSIRNWRRAVEAQRSRARQLMAYRGDNSNTQFAILGLWVAQRHGVPARSAVLTAERYFRATQRSDGSWTYHPKARNSRDSMTCAGLMSLAMRYGVIGGQGRDIRPAQPVHVSDAAIHRGLRYLAHSLDKIRVAGNRIVGADARDPLYFLWSLERMAVIFDLQKIGEREWYPWAAEMLVTTQRPDGRWPGIGGEPVCTCFALLILKRSNFAKDLQLAVRPPASRPPALSNGPTILQGPDALLGRIGKRQGPSSMPGTAISPNDSRPLGPSITRTPRDK